MFIKVWLLGPNRPGIINVSFIDTAVEIRREEFADEKCVIAVTMMGCDENILIGRENSLDDFHIKISNC